MLPIILEVAKLYFGYIKKTTKHSKIYVTV